MRKAKSLLGLSVISQQEGKQLGHIRDLIFDENSQKLLAVLLSDRDLFGMIDATVISWHEVREIGPSAVMVGSENALQKAHADPIIAESFDGKKNLDGKRVTTQGGEDLGRISDIYIEDDGYVQGFEVSGGLFADAFSGKRYMPRPTDLKVGEDVVLVPSEIASELKRQKETEPGGIAGAYQSASSSAAGSAGGLGDRASALYDSAKSKATETYDSIAGASVEKQRDFVIGKIAARDVLISSQSATIAAVTTPTSYAVTTEAGDILAAEDGGLVGSTGEVITPMQQPTYAMATDVSSTGEVVKGEVLVRQGETITAQHADRAIAAGVLGQLVFAANIGPSQGVLAQSQNAAANYGSEAQSKLETAALGKPSAREITAPDGTIIIAPGMIVTRDILDHAEIYGKKNEVIAAAGLGAASEKVQDTYASAKDAAGSLWDTIKEKTAELTGSAQEKKAGYDTKAEQNKINHALGRPVTRVILAKDDTIILNTGDLITNAAISQAREAEILPILLDSVFTADPEITPEMLRAQGKGEAALEAQIEPVQDNLTPATLQH